MRKRSLRSDAGGSAAGKRGSKPGFPSDLTVRVCPLGMGRPLSSGGGKRRSGPSGAVTGDRGPGICVWSQRTSRGKDERKHPPVPNSRLSSLTCRGPHCPPPGPQGPGPCFRASHKPPVSCVSPSSWHHVAVPPSLPPLSLRQKPKLHTALAVPFGLAHWASLPAPEEHRSPGHRWQCRPSFLCEPRDPVPPPHTGDGADDDGEKASFPDASHLPPTP